jgi:hypothetical protein
LEKEIREIVSNYIFGVDDETIESTIAKITMNLSVSPKVFLFDFPSDFELSIPNVIITHMASEGLQTSKANDFNIQFLYQSTNMISQNQITILSQSQSKSTRKYLGPPQSFTNWAKNIVLYYTWLEVKRMEQDKK